MLIPSRLESLPLSRFHRKLLILLGFGYFFDWLDILLISYIAPVIAMIWKLTPVETGVLLSSGFLGLFVGSVLAGFLSDYVGRKKLFQVTLLMFTVLTALTILSQNLTQLVVFRFFTGVGLGGELPVVASLLSEFIPSHSRGRYLSLLNGFNAFGALAAAVIGFLVVPKQYGLLAGWQVALLIGALPASYVWVIRRKLPESLRWLEARGKQDEALRMLGSIEGNVKGETTGAQSTATSAQVQFEEKVPFRELFSGRILRQTVLSWIVWSCLYLVFFTTLAWLPSLLVSQGFTLVRSLTVTLVLSVMFIPGFLSVSFLIERIGRRPTLVVFILLTALSLILWAHSNTLEQIIVWGSTYYFAGAGMINATASYTAEMFTTRVRGTGMGAASAVGRMANFLGVISVGLLYTSVGVLGIYTLYTTLLFVPVVFIFLLGRETKGKTLEEIAAGQGPTGG